MLADNFKEILDKYPEESNKPLKGNELARKMREEFNDNFKEMISEFVSPEYELVTKISHGNGEWVKVPWANSLYTAVSNTFQEGFYIYSVFDFENKKYKVGFGQGVSSISPEVYDERMNFLSSIAKEKFPDAFSDEKFNKFDENNDLLFKSIKYDDLTDDLLKETFKNLVKIYEELIPYYLDYLSKEEPSPDTLRPNNDGLRIWRIAPGGENASEVWNDFKENNYVGIGFNYADESIDYSKCKNIYYLKTILAPYTKVRSRAPNMVWKFTKWIRKGDIIITNLGRSKLAGIGIVTGDFISFPKNPNKKDHGLNNIYPVKWLLTPDGVDIGKNGFARNTLVEWTPNNWNQLICNYSKYDQNLKTKLIHHFYELFEDYLKKEEGISHIEGYKKESEHINTIWKKVLDKKERGESFVDLVWDEIINRDFKIHKDGSTNIKASLQGNLKFTDEDMDKVGVLFFETVNSLIGVTDISEQKRIMDEYAKNKYSKGFRSGRFSSVLYYLDNNYYVINKKSIDTVKVISGMFGDIINLKLDLKDYISNNEIYKSFLNKLAKEYDYDNFSLGDFTKFDAFCQVMCVGGYADEKGPIIKLDFITDENIDDISDDDFEAENDESDDITINEEGYSDDVITDKFEDLKLTPKLLESKLLDFSIKNREINRLCASLNAGKHIILDGTPGTGKTEIALKFSNATQENNFTNGYVLTTATSDWSTFDTIGGLMPNEKGELFFHQGKFLEAIEENKWLIIDEINRADIDKAFGQLFTVLSGQNVELPYKENGKSIKIVRWDRSECKHDKLNATYYIGNNWRIIGTMNVDDKDSLFDLSYAFMRRFMFIEIDLPEKEDYKKLIKFWASGLSDDYSVKLEALYKIVEYRKLGPAIFKDMIEYIKFRKELSDDDSDLIIAEAISSYILPQFEGLNRKKLNAIKEFLNNLELLEYLEDEIDEMIPKF